MSDVDDGGIDLELSNYPAAGEESYAYEVVFGPASPNLTILVEVLADEGKLALVIGNGPERADIPRVLSGFFRDIADAIEGLADNPGFLDVIHDFD